MKSPNVRYCDKMIEKKANWLACLAIALSVLSSVSCGEGTSRDAELESALSFAGENRHELEKVLGHYAEGTLRHEAARFLVVNMPGHYSFRDTLAMGRYASGVDSIVSAMAGAGTDSIRKAVDSLAERLGIGSLEKAYDSRTITAEYLIRNIDAAFEAWEGGRWARHLCFEEFCEALLPYKSAELQPLDGWREALDSAHVRLLDRLDYCDLYRNSPLAAAKVVNKALTDSVRPKADAKGVRHPHLPVRTLASLHMGECSDYACIAAAYLRSQGIPVYIDFTPQWAFRDLGHTWNVLPCCDGRSVPFSGVCTQPGQPHKEDERMPKVFRHTYARNPELCRLNSVEGYVPPVFRDVFVKDVTRESLLARDATVPVQPGVDGAAYLAVFDNREWTPVAYGTASGGKAFFRDMGTGVMYLPVRYDGSGTMLPIGDPFVLGYDGTCKPAVADLDSLRDVCLRRKYPVLPYVYKWLYRLEGGEFQASDDPRFRRRTVVHTISANHAWGHEVQLPDNLPAYRYWRYISYVKGAFCNMAEMSFYHQGDSLPLEGTVTGTSGSWKDNPGVTREKALDGDLLTFFDSGDPDSAWVGIDLGRPVKVERIVYYGRGDGNAVEAGDLYELFYWDGGGWASLGQKVAERPYLPWRGVPSGALLLLRDLTKGRDERIFTYEDGRQSWW